MPDAKPFNVEEFFQSFSFIVYFYMYCRWRYSYKEERALTGLNPPLFCAYPNQLPGSPTSYDVVPFVYSDNQCLSFVFKISNIFRFDTLVAMFGILDRVRDTKPILFRHRWLI